MSELRDHAIVRVMDGEGACFGMGIYVADGRVLTCAHVVADALEGRPSDLDPPAGELLVDFPILQPKQPHDPIRAWVPDRSNWCPCAEGPGGRAAPRDVALLELERPRVAALGVEIAPLVEDVVYVTDLHFRAIGVPENFDSGQSARGAVGTPLANGRYELIRTDPRHEPSWVREGFSGGGLWIDELEAFAGIVTRAAEEVARAEMIPTWQLKRVFRGIGRPARAGTEAPELIHLVDRDEAAREIAKSLRAAESAVGSKPPVVIAIDGLDRASHSSFLSRLEQGVFGSPGDPRNLEPERPLALRQCQWKSGGTASLPALCAEIRKQVAGAMVDAEDALSEGGAVTAPALRGLLNEVEEPIGFYFYVASDQFGIGEDQVLGEFLDLWRELGRLGLNEVVALLLLFQYRDRPVQHARSWLDRLRRRGPPDLAAFVERHFAEDGGAGFQRIRLAPLKISDIESWLRHRVKRRFPQLAIARLEAEARREFGDRGEIHMDEILTFEPLANLSS